MDLAFIDGLLPPGLLELSIFFAAASGFFFFGWNKVILPVFKSVYRTRYHEITFHISDEIYENVELWLADYKNNCYFSRTHKAVDKHQNSYEYDDGQHDPERHLLVPGFGSFLLWKRRFFRPGKDALPPITVTRSKIEKEGVYDHVEDITLRIFTSNMRKVEMVFNEIRTSTQSDPSEIVKMFLQGTWSSIGQRKDVPYVVSDCLDDVKIDMEKFLSAANRKFHAERNIPYRRGYLLSGPPGTGKSNFVAHISKEYGLPIYAMGDTFNLNELIRMFKTMRGPAIFLLEDIDLSKYGIKRGQVENSTEVLDGDSDSNPTKKAKKSKTEDSNMLRVFLNSLDGIVKTENFIFICTTNRKELLDDALTRPGRIDVVADMDLLTAKEQFRYYNKFYAKEVPTENVKARAIAEVSNIFAGKPHDPDGALEALRDL